MVRWGKTVSLDPCSQIQGANRHALGDTICTKAATKEGRIQMRDGARGLTKHQRHKFNKKNKGCCAPQRVMVDPRFLNLTRRRCRQSIVANEGNISAGTPSIIGLGADFLRAGYDRHGVHPLGLQKEWAVLSAARRRASRYAFVGLS